MLDTIIWGLIQGLTEFLPVSSSGHLVLVPAVLRDFGFQISEPELVVSAVLHLGTLLAVLVYFRRDLLALLRFRTDPGSRRLLWLLFLATLPATIGLPLLDTLDSFEENPRAVALALAGTGLILLIGSRLPQSSRSLEQATWKDAVAVGLAQALALVPGISRSGSTITAGVGMRLRRTEAARFAFLLAVPTIAGGGLLSLLELQGSGVEAGPLLVGLAVSAVSGYLAIAVLLRALVRVGLLPFAVYAFAFAAFSLLIL